jgi:hypothetical protein
MNDTRQAIEWQINGCISSRDDSLVSGPVAESLWDAIVDWCEAHGLHVGGGMLPVTDEAGSQDAERDLEADLLVCERATPGPWHADTTEPGDCVVWAEAPGYDPSIHVLNIGPARVGAVGVAFDSEMEDARFVGEARTGWPIALRRALAAEEALRQFKRAHEKKRDASRNE